MFLDVAFVHDLEIWTGRAISVVEKTIVGTVPRDAALEVYTISKDSARDSVRLLDLAGSS